MFLAEFEGLVFTWYDIFRDYIAMDEKKIATQSMKDWLFGDGISEKVTQKMLRGVAFLKGV